VGKTAAAIRLAKHLDTKIISADSRQCFKELNIGAATPSGEELLSVQHYFINSHSITEEVNAALFEQLALQWTENIFRDRDTVVMVGGPGLYIKAFCEGLDDMPPVDAGIRQQVQDRYEQEGLAWLQEQVQKNDPGYYSAGEILNPQRLMRALEVKLSTGNSILSFRSRQKKQRSFDIRKVGLHMPKEQLYQSINQRVHRMMEQGLLAEVEKLLPFKDLNALQTVGYSELFNYLEGKNSLEEAVELIQKNTRHYAKRQMTWFRKDPSIEWLDAGEYWPGLEKLAGKSNSRSGVEKK
jgi:tRNA dimethylallyltransferase